MREQAHEQEQEQDWLARRFEADRSHLRAVAYRMLGSVSEADDAVQEAWLRLSRSDSSEIQNLGGWLTTVVGRVCLDMLRSRRSRREDPLDWLDSPAEVRMPDPVITGEESVNPEYQALLADSVGLALLVVLETLAPAERLAFVLHDMFAVPFEEIASIVGSSQASARQLASRARRRVRGATPVAQPDPGRQREVVDAFLAAARGGDFEGLLAVLDPEVLLRADDGGGAALVRGASAVAAQALLFSRFSHHSRRAIVNGAAGLVSAPDGKAFSVLAFTVADGRIVEINLLADPERLARLDLAVLD
ncbi:sigma-70 family RNA polymerase sigma factor [Kitasatospora azatica]|uniref:sigma-70 family RNA polymerase sigma factor n=1 Tax=Kitasatospora azatica TaxID=58347 RepID=UPI0005684215|nr:sigma-70 family RNA polymerase sigma factor [Kitasatospora azatica]